MPAPPLEWPVRYVGTIVDTNEPISDFSDSPSVSITIDVSYWGIQSIDRSLIPPSLRQKFEGGEYACTCLLDEIDVALNSDNTSRVIFGILSYLLIAACCVLVFLACNTTSDKVELYMAIFLQLLCIPFVILVAWRSNHIGKKLAKIQKGKQTKIT